MTGSATCMFEYVYLPAGCRTKEMHLFKFSFVYLIEEIE